MKERFKLLQERFGEIADLQAASAVLQWDQETYMPPGGGRARAEALSTIQKTAHGRLVADEIAHLLDETEAWAQAQGPDSFEAAFLRAARRDHARAKKLPGELVAELAKATALGLEAWKEARERSDFSAFAPHLERIVGLNRRKAEALAVGERLYDSLLDEYEPGTKTSQVEATFRGLREGLVPLVREIVARQDQVSNDILAGACGEKPQFKLCQDVVRRLAMALLLGGSSSTLRMLVLLPGGSSSMDNATWSLVTMACVFNSCFICSQICSAGFNSGL